jgi:hypothetical protein
MDDATTTTIIVLAIALACIACLLGMNRRPKP